MVILGLMFQHKGSEEGEKLMELIRLHFTTDLKLRNAILTAKSLYAEI